MTLNKKTIQWEIVYKELSPKILGICRKYVKSYEVAEDLMHETFITAINKIEQYSGKGTLKGWISKIAVNHALLYLRGQKKTEFLNENFETSDEIEENYDDNKIVKNIVMKTEFDENELIDILHLIPNHHKTVFNMYVIDGYTHKEIAQLLNISIGTSKSHLARARKKLQQLLYESAMSKQNKHNKEKYMFLLLFTNKNYVDNLFRKKLSGFEVVPQNSSAFFSQLNITSKISLIPKFSYFIATKYILIGCVTLVASYLIYHKYFDIKTTDTIALPSSSGKAIVSVKHVVKIDSTFKEKNNKPLDNKKKVEQKTLIQKPSDSISNHQNNRLAPVIIHKQIIVRDTVYQSKPQKNE